MKKIIKFMFLFILLIFNTSCSQKRNYSMEFNEGLFKYEGEPLLFYKGMIDDEEKEIYLEQIELEITKINIIDYMKDTSNTMVNIANHPFKKRYRGILKMQFSCTELRQYDFTFSYISVIPDRYYIYPLTTGINGEDIKLIFRFYKRYDKEFDVRDYYFDIGERHYVNEKSVYFAEQKIYHLRYQDY